MAMLKMVVDHGSGALNVSNHLDMWNALNLELMCKARGRRPRIDDLPRYADMKPTF
jgi:hypothetical protein